MTQTDSTIQVPSGDTAPSDGRDGSCRERLIAYREALERDLTGYTRLETRWSWLRLVGFLICVAVVAGVGFWCGLPLAALAALPAVVAFRYVVLRHIRWKDERIVTERLLTVVGESLGDGVAEGRPVRDWRRPKDAAEPSMALNPPVESGPTWPLTDQERDDLDLYAAPVGVFGLLNRTSTDTGARRLRDMLDEPCLSSEPIRQRQQAVRWLAEHDRERIDIMASALPLRGRSSQVDTLVLLLRRTVPNPHPVASKVIRVWSVPSAVGLAWSVYRIANGHFAWARVFTLLLVLNVLIAYFNRRMLVRVKESAKAWVEMARPLQALLVHARHAGEHLPDQTMLGLLRASFASVIERGEIPSLCARIGWMNLGGPVRSLLDIAMFYDLHVGEAILARAVPSRDVILDGLAALAEFEALASLACFSAEQPVVCYPQLTSDVTVSIVEGRHPLIGRSEPTPNSLSLTGAKRMWVVTGPNAAGKSTFLRMAGVNVLLAQVGSGVPAREMTLSPVRLLTDVRIRDDLAKSESYFLSEVRRLRRMVVDTGQDAPLLGLIDEPFRGTNSSERIAAGVALVEHLLACGNLFLLATHEERLAQTAAGSMVAENYHFREHLGDEGVTFDYRLRPGPADTRTAIRILEQERYPAGLLERARELMQRDLASDQDSS
ncbi:MAG: hypothetical protein JW993_07775 [Sedimentisphaerales bacterium]|nr:hypothetical protein [Sedimentisphaerales bacterium]